MLNMDTFSVLVQHNRGSNDFISGRASFGHINAISLEGTEGKSMLR